MEKQNEPILKNKEGYDNLNLLDLLKKLLYNRKQIYKAIGIGAVIGLIVGFSLPRTYTVNVMLAPELGSSRGNSLSNMAAMLGIGGMAMNNEQDALNIRFYPDVVSSNPFILELFALQVQTKDGKIDTTLVDYVCMQKRPWWNKVISLPFRAIGSVLEIFIDRKEDESKNLDPFNLTKFQNAQLKAIKKSIICNVDKKTGATTVSVTMQDPKVAAQVADKVIENLQNFITKYRINKAKQDCEYQEKLYKEAKASYYCTQQKYTKYADANLNVIKKSTSAELERLRNEMNLAFQVYSQVATQLQMAKAKVQEAKPVFAVVEPATIPLEPSGAGKSVILIVWIFLAFVFSSTWILVGKDLWTFIKNEWKETAKRRSLV